MTEMRPDPDSDLAGSISEYGDDTGFAAEATRTSPEVTQADTEDDTPSGEVTGDVTGETEAAVAEPGPGAGGD